MHIDKIKFERTGGFAGIRLAAEIEMDDLPDDQKREITRILDDADIDDISVKSSGKMPIPDGFTYSITINSRDKEHHMITGEASIPDDLHPLIEILERIAKSQMRNKG